LPWVDNYAHLFGFIFGFLLSYAILPFVTFGRNYDRRRKLVLVTVSHENVFFSSSLKLQQK
jgi:membrane associated rhomboid family serine protease